ncbi:uncharacterized protein LOC121915634 isoform X1 [Sceloporus undulatus]|uniref:uncharacterized protein LOC121915634 isoform X1 n=1 Tax=Sceloporus undulatus TaxID=8520 RepID=UPI001C4BF642|nr:uncharacterized protein LOC121915634 isoform X1 [Sceloporus undulatus]
MCVELVHKGRAGQGRDVHGPQSRGREQMVCPLFLLLLLLLLLPGEEQEPLIKGCGAEDFEDALLAYQVGRDFAYMDQKVCRLNNCNNRSFPDIPAGRPNGLQCYTCRELGRGDCAPERLLPLNCSGDMDWCLHVIGKGEAIFCYNCTSATGYKCSTAEEACSSSVNSCITIARKEHSGAHETENPAYEKKCNSDDRLCNQFYGLLAGDFRMHWNSSCCRFDRCNTREVIVQKASQKPNGVHCNSCFARGTDLCLNHTHVACTGLLTHCIHFATTAKNEEFKEEQVAFTGCATKNVCDMGAVALFAASQNVEVKSNLCSGGAPRAPGQDGLALSLMAALPFLAFWL